MYNFVNLSRFGVLLRASRAARPTPYRWERVALDSEAITKANIMGVSRILLALTPDVCIVHPRAWARCSAALLSEVPARGVEGVGVRVPGVDVRAPQAI